MDPLTAKEETLRTDTRWRWAILTVVGLVWTVALVLDWAGRFRWFRWHDRIIFTPLHLRLARVTQPWTTNVVPERWGGDLTRLIGIPSFAQRFEEYRPAAVQTRDREGFRNPVMDGQVPSIVVVGDSYMASGEPITNLFSVRLSALAGVPVYNRALEGVGPFLSVSRFVDSDLFRTSPPRLVVWGFIEREAVRHQFAGLAYQLDIRAKGIRPKEHLELSAQTRQINWYELTASRLRNTLPSTSLLAQLSQRAWNLLRYLLLGQITPEVIPSRTTVAGKRLLFYRPALEVTFGDPSERDPKEIAWAVGVVRDFLAQRGVRLLVLLIPDKETVYRDAVPPEAIGGRPWPESCLMSIERELREAGIPVVNLLPVFEELARQGELLYWPDDTHWNERGIAIAAEEVWKTIKKENLLSESR